MYCAIHGDHNSVFITIRQVRLPPARKERGWRILWELLPQTSCVPTQQPYPGGTTGNAFTKQMCHPPGMQQYPRCFVLCFIFVETSSLPYSVHRLLTSFFAFSVLPCLLPKASSGKPEQKVAGTWPVCPPRKAPSQKEGAPRCVPGICCSVWKGSMTICLGLYLTEPVLTAKSHGHVDHGPVGTETSAPMQHEQWQL